MREVERFGRPFSEVLCDELKAIKSRRKLVDGVPPPSGDKPRYVANKDLPASPMINGAKPSASAGLDSPATGPSQLEKARREALEMNLTGLAISGGGIRSGTLALGVLQGLASLKLLSRFDYLSTVSGGGYAGSWLAAWIKRDGKIRNVEKQLAPSRVAQSDANRAVLKRGQVVDEEPEPLYHLRAYSNYLTPRPGTFTTDTWTILSIYLRNSLINLSYLVPATMAVVLLTRLIVLFYDWRGAWREFFANAWLAWFGVSLIFAVAVLMLEQLKVRASTETEDGPSEERFPRTLRFLVVWPLLAVAVTSVWLFSINPDDKTSYRFPEWINPLHDLIVHNFEWLPPWARLPAIFGLVLLLPFAMVTLVSFFNGQRQRPAETIRLAFSFLVMGSVGGLLFWAILMTLVWNERWNQPYALATFGPPLVLLALVVAGYAQIAVAGRALREYEREWRSRMGAVLLLHAAAWLALFGVTLYLPWGLLQIPRGYLSAGALLGWLGPTISGVAFSRSPETGGKPGDKPSGNLAVRLIAQLAPPIFLIGLLACVSMLVSLLLHQSWPGVDRADLFLERTRSTPFWELVCWLLGVSGFAAIIMLVVDINNFSLHAMYANRLTRCYLGASRAKKTWARRIREGVWGPGTGGAPIRTQEREGFRQENLFSGFDPKDDIPLHELDVDAKATERPGGYTGPFPLINTTLNLVAGGELAYQDRKAESFVLTPLYCGSRGTGYARLPGDDPHTELTLGRAMAISGAAADPNMGYNQSAAQTALMTVFNARLGWWIQNPGLHEPWEAKGPNYGLLLFDELFGNTKSQSSYVHLSDGGHFDNLGVYELVRRRCRYIVACDLAQDLSDASENLSNAIRLCRRDFGVRIEIDTTSLRKDNDGLSRSHCSIGTIHYEDVDAQAIPGMLVFIRSSMTGDEPPDVRNYAINNPTFPHQSTADQFFDEAQFESYRALGFHIAHNIFSQADAGDDSDRLFSKLRHHWFPSPADLEEKARDVAQAFFNLQEEIRLDPHLREFSLDLYPELGAQLPGRLPPVNALERDRAELHIVSQILQTMQAAWRQVKLEGYPEHPMNRGWSNVFRRCARTQAFHKHWPALRAGLNTEFARFCEQELRLPAHALTAVEYTPPTSHRDMWLDRFDAEFAREWPSEVAAGRGLPALRSQAEKVWLIREESSTDGFVFGIILIYPESDMSSGNYNLVVWILGPHRNVGIGRRCLEKPIEEIQKKLETLHPEGFSITVRLPETGPLGGADKPREDLWLNFFYHYGFRREQERSDRTIGSTLVMVWTYCPKDSAREAAPVSANGGPPPDLDLPPLSRAVPALRDDLGARGL